MGLRPTQGDEKTPRSRNHSLWNRCPFLCHPERTRISYCTALTRATYVVLPKENHMHLTEAATLDRKSGEADLSRRAVEGSVVPRTSRGNVFRPDRTRISCLAALDTTTCAAFFKESRMKFVNATDLHRKSGVAEWRDLRCLFSSHAHSKFVKTLWPDLKSCTTKRQELLAQSALI
jgi:hypothetical protein